MELIAAILSAIVSKQLADEFKAWMPRAIDYLICRALRRLPEDERARYLEEWHSHISEIPGDIGKLVVAMQLSSAARQMSSLLSQPAQERTLEKFISEAFALLVAAMSLWLIAPIFGLIAIVTKLESRGPCFCTHECIGLNGKTIYLYSFRTLKDTKALKTDSLELKNDRYQLTTTGRFLRRNSLDILPALISIVKGDLALVGPAPHCPSCARFLSRALPKYTERMKVKPGLFGLAQLSGSSDPIENLDKDLFYINNRSLKLDLKILIKGILNFNLLL